MGAHDSPYRSRAEARKNLRIRSFHDPRSLFGAGIAVLAAALGLVVLPFVHETGWKDVLPVFYLTALSLAVTAFFSGSARVSFDPEAPVPEIEVETKPAWFRRARRERVPLGEIEAVRMLKVEPRRGATYWQVALARRDKQPVPIGVPVGLDGARRWHRRVMELIDPGSELSPPSSIA